MEDTSRAYTDETDETIGRQSLPQVAEVYIRFTIGNETTGEVSVRWYQLEQDQAPVPRLEAYNDSWKALLDSGLAHLLADHEGEDFTPADLMNWLGELGYTHEPRGAHRPPELDISVRHANANDRYDAARLHLEPILEEWIASRVAEAFPEADTLHVRGEYNEEGGFIVRAQHVSVGGQTRAGYGTSAEEWDDFIDSGIDDDLDRLGDLTGESYLGDQEITIPEKYRKAT